MEKRRLYKEKVCKKMGAERADEKISNKPTLEVDMKADIGFVCAVTVCNVYRPWKKCSTYNQSEEKAQRKRNQKIKQQDK